MIFRCLQYPCRESLTFAYKTYVLPLFEYGSSVYNSINRTDSNRLEACQRWCTRVIFRKCHLSAKGLGYEYRLSFLDLQKLSSRRRQNDLILLHQIVHGKHICPDVVSMKPCQKQFRHNFRIWVPSTHSTEVLKQFPYRCLRDWNCLSDDIISLKIDKFSEFIRSNFF